VEGGQTAIYQITRGDDLSCERRVVGRILVVDDSAENRTLLANILSTRGYSVTTAPDGMLAWSLLQQSGDSFSLVITDFMMPKLNGIELLERVRAAYPRIKVVLVTGHLDEAITSRARRLGAFAVLPKPCELKQLYGIIRRALPHSPTIG